MCETVHELPYVQLCPVVSGSFCCLAARPQSISMASFVKQAVRSIEAQGTSGSAVLRAELASQPEALFVTWVYSH